MSMRGKGSSAVKQDLLSVIRRSNKVMSQHVYKGHVRAVTSCHSDIKTRY